MCSLKKSPFASVGACGLLVSWLLRSRVEEPGANRLNLSAPLMLACRLKISQLQLLVGSMSLSALLMLGGKVMRVVLMRLQTIPNVE